MDNEQLNRIEAKVDQLLASKPAPRAASTPASSGQSGEVKPAPDSDLDSEYGNFVVKKDPPRYKGPSFAGKKLSQTSPDFCDAVMSLALWKAGKDIEAGDEKKAGYARRDAERALGWKLRLEGGYKADAAVESDEDIPFSRAA